MSFKKYALSAAALGLLSVSALAAPFAYVPNEGSGTLSVIDTDTDKVVREIPPKELQNVYERIREAIGLLLDESA